MVPSPVLCGFGLEERPLGHRLLAVQQMSWRPPKGPQRVLEGVRAAPVSPRAQWRLSGMHWASAPRSGSGTPCGPSCWPTRSEAAAAWVRTRWRCSELTSCWRPCVPPLCKDRWTESEPVSGAGVRSGSDVRWWSGAARSQSLVFTSSNNYNIWTRTGTRTRRAATRTRGPRTRSSTSKLILHL